MSTILAKDVNRRAFLKGTGASALFLGLGGWPGLTYGGEKVSLKGHSVVVVGSGLGGLTCGAYLARQGARVTVLERHSKAGGYATSFTRAGGRFDFEVSVHGAALNNNAPARTLAELGVLRSLELVRLSEVFALKIGDMEIAIPQQDPQAYIEVLSKHFPHERRGIGKFVNELVGITEEADKLHQRGSYSKLTFPWRYPKMNKVRKKTLASFLKGYVKDEALKKVLGSLWDFHGLPPSQVSGLYYGVTIGDCLKNGTFYVKNRSGDLTAALIGIIKGAGGQVLYNSPVARINTTGKRVRGVTLADGTLLPAGIVVNNANVPSTFTEMLSSREMPRDFCKRVDGYQPSFSTFIVWLGLKRELRGRFPSCGYQVMPAQDAEADYRACLGGEVEKVPFRISVFDNMYAGYSRPGTSTVKIFCLTGFEPWRQYESAYVANRKGAYRREKQRWAEVLLRRAQEAVLGDLSEVIEVKESASPLTNRRYTGNPLGAIYGFEQGLHQAYMDRVSNRSPVTGLYLAGAWTTPGGGFVGSILSGRMAFTKIMEDCAG